jgi:hypothetical protein
VLRNVSTVRYHCQRRNMQPPSSGCAEGEPSMFFSNTVFTCQTTRRHTPEDRETSAMHCAEVWPYLQVIRRDLTSSALYPDFAKHADMS